MAVLKPEARRAEGQDGFPPARPLVGRPTWPWQEPCRGNLPNTSKTATLEPESYDAIDNARTKARERLHGGMQIFEKTKGVQA